VELADSILIMHCAEGAKKALARMSEAGHKLPPRFKTFELPCTGNVNEVLLMENLQNGASGVVVLGCRRENCKHLDGNLKAERKVARIKQLLADSGAEGKFVEMVFTAPDEGKKLHDTLLGFDRAGVSEGKGK
jgi:coenzyme F420-reducing hydrogenase delta subunit